MRKMKNMRNGLKILGGLFLLMSILFITVASAEETSETHITVSSAGAQAIATGSIAIASTDVTITSNEASASATAKAKAENGEIATAIAEAWASWIDGSSAHARSVATAVAGIGETIWAETKATVSVSTNRASAKTVAYVGNDPNYIDEDSDSENSDNENSDSENSDNGEVLNSENSNSGIVYPVPIKRPDTLSGFVFGRSDAERYCTYELQLADDDPENDHRAEYYLDIIVWDYKFNNRSDFKTRYNINCVEGTDTTD